MLIRSTLSILLAAASFPALAQSGITKLNPVSFSQVTITDNFWKPKLEKIATTAVPVMIYQTEIATGRIRNYEKVARQQKEKHEGIYYDDSDVYKALEAIAYSLKNHSDKAMEQKADEWIDKIAAAQEKDGYINSFYSLTGLENRWTDMEKHEDYCAGHLMEAGVAYFQTTGKRKLLDVAIKMADHIDETFRKQNRPWVSGHEEIELALVKLYKTTGDKKYLELSDWFLDQRGHGHGKGGIWDNPHWGPKYAQDDVPVKEQKEITGHAVRAMYLYTGAADVASAQFSICIGNGRAANRASICIDGEGGASASGGNNAIAIGTTAASTGGGSTIAIGQSALANTTSAMAIGPFSASATGAFAVALGREVTASLRAQFETRPFSSIFWGGSTTNATPTVLNLDAQAAATRFTIAANTALAVDVLLVARRSDTQDKWLVARRFLGIRRDGSNNTSLIGSVQTLGVDQSDGSPSWTFALTADDTNEALQLEVTGAASETIQWRATAFYRVA
jgi:hypothetical protein